MLGFFRLGSMGAALVGALAMVGAFGGCGPSAGTCSADGHSVLSPDGSSTLQSCTADQACAVEGASAGCATCDPTQCLPKNDCIKGYALKADAIAGDTSKEATTCRLKCSVPTDCPFNYHCIASDSGQGYCAKDRPAGNGADYKPTTTGVRPQAPRRGAMPCRPDEGLRHEQACDTRRTSGATARRPTDANAFCTQYQCDDDADCPGGWWCGTINDSPERHDDEAQRLGHDDDDVCLPRAYDLKPGSYCAPCKSDDDCPTNDARRSTA